MSACGQPSGIGFGTVHTLEVAPRARRAGPAVQKPRRSAPTAATVITLIVAAGALAHTPTVHAARTGASVTGVRLELPRLYLALAPACDVLDTVEGLALHAHYALMGAIALAALAWPRRARMRVRVATAAGAIVSTYGLGVYAPRPVARLHATDPSLVIVDFHSHTRASHDGRPWFTVERNRAWHRATGFDVAYVTDHESVASTTGAMAANPELAGDGTVLLPGIELHDGRNHVNVLGVRPMFMPAFEHGVIDGAKLADIAARANVPRPLVLYTVPGTLRHADDSGVIDAIELSDGAPRGLDQSDVQRDTLIDYANDRELASVAGSNDHGLARAASAWSVLEIPGWRAMSPLVLDDAIRRTVRMERENAVTVVERRTRMPGRTLGTRLVLSVPSAAWGMFARLSWAERCSWLAWAWGLTALARARSSIRSGVSRLVRRRPAARDGGARRAA